MNPDKTYPKDIFNIDELLTSIHAHIYDKTQNYISSSINFGDIITERFKITNDESINEDRLKLLDSILEKSKFITKMKTGIGIDELLLRRDGEKGSFVFIVPYSDNENIDNLKDPINNNIMIRTIMSEFIINGKLNCILTPILNVTASGKELSKYKIIQNHIDKDKNYLVQVTERFYKVITLKKFIEKYGININILKSIIYQLADFLNVSFESFPSFRSNCLTADKILCYLKEINGEYYPDIKIHNFYLSEISKIQPNKYLNETNYEQSSSIYSDIFIFMKDLMDKFKDKLNDKEIKSFIDEIFPETLRNSEKFDSKFFNNMDADEIDRLSMKNLKRLCRQDTQISQKYNVDESTEDIQFAGSTESDLSIPVINVENEPVSEHSSFELSEDDQEDKWNDKDNNKKSKKSHISNMTSKKKTSRITYEEEAEPSDDIIPSPQNRISESVPKKRKVASGYRQIRRANNSSKSMDNSQLNKLRSFLDDSDPMMDSNQYNRNMSRNVQNNIPSMGQNDGTLRMNSIGSLLGANQNDIQKMNNNFSNSFGNIQMPPPQMDGMYGQPNPYAYGMMGYPQMPPQMQPPMQPQMQPDDAHNAYMDALSKMNMSQSGGRQQPFFFRQ